MLIENSFEIPSDKTPAWDLLLDVPRVVGCIPGAELVETLGEDAWRAKLHIKLGPMKLQLLNDVVLEQADPERGTVALRADGRDVSGRGTAKVAIDSTVSSVEGGTRVDIRTDLQLAGKIAQFGRGIVRDVAAGPVSALKLLRAALGRMLRRRLLRGRRS